MKQPTQYQCSLCIVNAGRVLKSRQAEASFIVLAQLSHALPAAARAVSDAEML